MCALHALYMGGEVNAQMHARLEGKTLPYSSLMVRGRVNVYLRTHDGIVYECALL